VLAVGGPWTIDHVAPLADRVEVMPLAYAQRDGRMNPKQWSGGPPDLAVEMLKRAKQANPGAVLGINATIAVGTGAAVDAIVKLFGDGPAHGLAGPPHQVADTLLALADHGVDCCSLGEAVPGSYQALAPYINR
jgi:hypothetical protein